MTKKHYQLVADAIAVAIREQDPNDEGAQKVLNAVVYQLSKAFGIDNERFNPTTFGKACWDSK